VQIIVRIVHTVTTFFEALPISWRQSAQAKENKLDFKIEKKKKRVGRFDSCEVESYKTVRVTALVVTVFPLRSVTWQV